MNLLAAIDLRASQAVRLLQGDYAKETRYGDPRALAQRFVAQGADWLHLVDLDAARDGGAANRAHILAIAQEVGVPVETGGGIRTRQDVEGLLEGGVDRVILGTAALEDPTLLEEVSTAFPGHVAVGLDYRRNDADVAEVAVRGWLAGAGLTLSEAIERVARSPIAALVITAIDRDGTLGGPDLAGLSEAQRLTSIPIVASGGVGSVADISAIADLVGPSENESIEGVVVGKAIVEGMISIAEAVSACR